MVTEKLLHFIWQHQYFNKEDLQTVAGERLVIQHTGTLNFNQGPDFIKASIQINETVWIGNVEIHINSSDWDLHKHSEDVHYHNVILHVVWNHDKELKTPVQFSTLELKPLVAKMMLHRYSRLQEKQSFVPCEEHLPTLSKMSWLAWKERLCIERLEVQSKQILKQASENNNHWEEVFWHRLARNFGLKLNADLFEQTAKTITISLLARLKNHPLQIEALIFGQANLLPEAACDDYTATLITEYEYLKKLHHLRPVKLLPVFLRMRPAGFPTVRAVQMAGLMANAQHLFTKTLEADTIKQLKKLLHTEVNDYWDHHYVFGEVSAFQPKRLGFEMMNNIIINTIVPIVFSYGILKDEVQLKEKAIHWLVELTAEQNQYTRKWTLFNVSNENAFDSQALLHLKTMYCQTRRCLECAVGNQLMAAAAEPAHVN